MSILSIQSHVVYGHAGNSAAVFPLQRLGREVWAVNTVEFSNHTGYKAWRGKAMDAALVDDLILGLEERGVLDRCEAVLSGYLGDPESGRAIIRAVKKVRSFAPRAVYCCDPVMGDVGRGFYVYPEIPAVFKEEVLPLAHIITPNQFELEALTGIASTTLDGARAAIKALHEAGPAVVLVTSYREGESTGALGSPENSGEHSAALSMLVSDGGELWRVTTPALFFENSAAMAGSGDLTTAVFLSRYLEGGGIARALEQTAGAVYGIIEATHRARSRELLIVEAQEELAAPRGSFSAERI
ncbi:MAG: pyridoxal kinase PdxY [Treponema sp.]|jgi:pyridoxine kinase|nr:pyridoxal kinase PdxY [Treponema sp.]